MSQAHQSQDRVSFLGETPLFQDLPTAHLTDLAHIAIAQSYRKGTLIFHQGDAANGFFLVRSGRVKVFKVSVDGKEQILHLFGKGEHFAEVPALDGQCFPASAAAITAVEVLFFPRLAFLELLEQQPQLAINLLISFARHLRHFAQLVDSLVLQDVPARLAAYLLQLPAQESDADTVILDLPKGQLAARLGTIPETLSRVFARFSREGLVKVKGSQITLLDQQRLQTLSGL